MFNSFLVSTHICHTAHQYNLENDRVIRVHLDHEREMKHNKNFGGEKKKKDDFVSVVNS